MKKQTICLSEMKAAVALAAQVESVDHVLAQLKASEDSEHPVTISGGFPGPSWSALATDNETTAKLREMARAMLSDLRAKLMRDLEKMGVTP